ncbi:MAG: hypothetical protein LUI14_15205 [Lachnospiraceae bacterium]|nr:hypothetical protein [Lachnospiraceae bacterium]
MPEELDSTEKLFEKHSSKPYNPKLANTFFKSGMNIQTEAESKKTSQKRAGMIPANMRGWQVRMISIPFRDNPHLFREIPCRSGAFQKVWFF